MIKELIILLTYLLIISNPQKKKISGSITRRKKKTKKGEGRERIKKNTKIKINNNKKNKKIVHSLSTTKHLNNVDITHTKK